MAVTAADQDPGSRCQTQDFPLCTGSIGQKEVTSNIHFLQQKNSKGMLPNQTGLPHIEAKKFNSIAAAQPAPQTSNPSGLVGTSGRTSLYNGKHAALAARKQDSCTTVAMPHGFIYASRCMVEPALCSSRPSAALPSLPSPPPAISPLLTASNLRLTAAGLRLVLVFFSV